jgi:hypothetical protein
MNTFEFDIRKISKKSEMLVSFLLFQLQHWLFWLSYDTILCLRIERNILFNWFYHYFSG